MKIVLLFWFSGLLFLSAQTTTNVDNYINAKEYKKAKALLLKEIQSNPSTAVKSKLADVYSYLKEWDNAITLYKELVVAYPKNADYHFKYGGITARKAQSGSRIRALSLIGTIRNSFIKASELDPKHVNARWGLLDFYLSVPIIFGGSTTKAYKYANELASISPIEGHFALAYVYVNDGEPEKATMQYLKTLDYIPNIKRIERNQLNYLIGKVSGDYNQHIDIGILKMKDFIKNYTIKDGVPLYEAYYRLAKLYRLKKDRTNANIWINKAIANQTNFKQAIVERELIETL